MRQQLNGEENRVSAATTFRRSCAGETPPGRLAGSKLDLISATTLRQRARDRFDSNSPERPAWVSPVGAGAAA